MKRLALVASLLGSANALAASSADFNSVAAQCAPGVHIKTLSSIVRHESRTNPYAIGVNAKGVRLPRQPANKEEAIATAKWLKDRGYSFDSGYGQVNSANLDWLFDPCKNLAGAARVITDCYKRARPLYSDEQAALLAALSCYNTGNWKDGFSNGYVGHVMAAANTTLDVPALVPSTNTNTVPVQLKASGRVAHVQQPPPKPLPDGIGDAFSHPSGGVFAPAPEQTANDQNIDSGLPKGGPVMLKAE
jgi:type IV secretion system protein VirB1